MLWTVTVWADLCTSSFVRVQGIFVNYRHPGPRRVQNRGYVPLHPVEGVALPQNSGKLDPMHLRGTSAAFIRNPKPAPIKHRRMRGFRGHFWDICAV